MFHCAGFEVETGFRMDISGTGDCGMVYEHYSIVPGSAFAKD